MADAILIDEAAFRCVTDFQVFMPTRRIRVNETPGEPARIIVDMKARIIPHIIGLRIRAFIEDENKTRIGITIMSVNDREEREPRRGWKRFKTDLSFDPFLKAGITPVTIALDCICPSVIYTKCGRHYTNVNVLPALK
ncbi:hypothetical protein SCUCBS95973_007722 [Sporothrix curviconia]|uniref:Uncharacterized protein n=1 Tax=Sporothrix curviconia TaxID=1260050 RepID=A0ABP0CII3_9PEZI